MDLGWLIEALKVASEDASLIVGGAGFILTLGAAVAAGVGLWMAGVETRKTQLAKRASEEEAHVLQLVKLASNWDESKSFHMQLAAISLLAHHPKYIETMRDLERLWTNYGTKEHAAGKDPDANWFQMAALMKQSISAAEKRRRRWFRG